MRHLSLKTKMAGLVSLLVAGILLVTAFLVDGYFEKNFRESIANHQFSLVSAMAAEIDSKILAAQDQIVAVAGGVTREMLANLSLMEKYLTSQAAVLQTFDNGIFLFSATGRMLTGTGMEPHMWGRDYSNREYYQEAIHTGKPYISKPFLSSQAHGHPIIMLTAPIVGADGKMVALLVGSLDLLGKNFLSRLIELKVGEKGYLYLFNSDRTMILHPDPSRILANDVPVGANRLFDLAIEGFDGSGETVNSRGLHAFASFKQLQSTDWILAVNYPLAEAYAPITQARRYFLAGLAGLLALSILSVWLFMGRLTRPLLQITASARAIGEGEEEFEPLPVVAGDEIGVLASAFNRMMAVIEQQQEAIREQKEFAENLLEHAAAPIFVIDAEHRVVIWNRACEELTGIRAAEIKGTDGHWRAFYEQPRHCLADFAVGAQTEGLTAGYEQHERSTLVQEGLRAEGWLLMANGRRHYLSFNAAPIRNKQGEIVAAIETLEDLTERKEAEKRLEQMAHFDTVTNLPNRTLFFDRLEQGMAAAVRYGHILGLLYLDLDDFKQVNDCAGHDAGDQLLAAVARRLETCVRRSDTVARVGGDEFTVILTQVAGAAEAEMVAAHIVEALAAPFSLGERRFTLGVSIGISLCPANGDDADSLVKQADTAMYRVKEVSKNSYGFYMEESASGGATRSHM
ncbi:MAG: diguanylate cyclase domain-containing protein [Desulfopila sp.]